MELAHFKNYVRFLFSLRVVDFLFAWYLGTEVGG